MSSSPFQKLIWREMAGARVQSGRRTKPAGLAPSRGARGFLSVDSSAKLFPAARGAHEYVAALVERGSRRAPHFGDFHQAEPTWSATVGDRVYSGARTLPHSRANARVCPKARCISPRASRIGSPTREPARRPCASLTGCAIGRRPSPLPSELPTEDARGRRRPVDPSAPLSSLRTEPA
jgi:hypothetical protein